MLREPRWLLASALAVLAASSSGCESEPDPGSGSTADTRVAYLTPEAELVRISMALRGQRPSVTDLVAVRADRGRLPAIVDGYLESAAFGETMRELHNEALLVRVAAGIYPAGFAAKASLSGIDSQLINVSVTEAPLRFIEHVIMNDRPYTEIVTADYTVADGQVAQVWGIEHAGDPAAWQKGRYLDGRPHAGVLSDSMVFTRHSTTYSNANRGRANAMAKALLCYDFLSREIEIDATINLADPEEVKNAVRENAACASCHQTLDPLAAYFSAFHPIFVPSDIESYPFAHYLPTLSRVFSASDPAYFGYSGGGLADLGQRIANDPRFSLCAAKRFYGWFHQVALSEVPFGRAAELQAALIESGFSAKKLARAIVLGDDFRVSHSLTEEDADAVHGIKKARPGQLARVVEQLTGFRWQTWLDFDVGSGRIGLVDLMTDSLFGFEVLAGGIDSTNVTLPAHTMTASASLTLRSLAARAAPFAISHDFARLDTNGRKLFTLVSERDSDEALVRKQIAELHLRLYGEFVEPDAEAVNAGYELFRGALAEAAGDVRRAWSVTLFAMLQDARIAYY